MKKSLLVLVLLTGLVSNLASAQARSIGPKDFTITPAAANEYWSKKIAPLLDRHTDAKEIPGIRNRLNKLAIYGTSGELGITPIPAADPHNPQRLAHLDYDLPRPRPTILIFVPVIQRKEKELNTRDFEDLLALTFAHEMIHWEQGHNGEFSPLSSRAYRRDTAEDVREEASAFGKTILEIVRPWAAQGRIPERDLLRLSAQLKSVGDDYKDPRWVLAFKDYNK